MRKLGCVSECESQRVESQRTVACIRFMQQYQARHLISVRSTLDKMSIYATLFSYYALLVNWFAATATVQLHILKI